MVEHVGMGVRSGARPSRSEQRCRDSSARRNKSPAMLVHRERERERERQTDRQAGRQTARQTDRQGDRQTDRQANREFLSVSPFEADTCISTS